MVSGQLLFLLFKCIATLSSLDDSQVQVFDVDPVRAFYHAPYFGRAVAFLETVSDASSDKRRAMHSLDIVRV